MLNCCVYINLYMFLTLFIVVIFGVYQKFNGMSKSISTTRYVSIQTENALIFILVVAVFFFLPILALSISLSLSPALLISFSFSFVLFLLSFYLSHTSRCILHISHNKGNQTKKKHTVAIHITFRSLLN